MLRVVGYCRCSTDRQDDSNDTQRRLIAERCVADGFKFLRSFDDTDVSASVPVERRPAGKELFNLVKQKNRGFDAIMVLRLDRLFRDPEDELGGLGFLTKHDCQIISIKDPIDRSTPVGELLHGIMMHVRTFERRQTGERIREHNYALALQGKWAAGEPPVGFSYDPETKIIKPNDQAQTVVEAFQTFIDCGGNAAATAAILNREGHLTRGGRLWRGDGVLNVLRSPVYRQKIPYDGRVFDAEDTIPAIVPVALLNAVDDILSRRMPVKRSKPYQRPYSGILTCSLCGANLRCKSNRHTDDDGSTRDYVGWLCANRKEYGPGVCPASMVANIYVDRMVGKALEGLLLAYKKDLTSRPHKKPKQSTRTASKRTQLTDQRERWKNLFVMGHITLEEYQRNVEELDKRLKILAEAPEPIEITMEMVDPWLKTIAGCWPERKNEEKIRLLTMIDAQIVVNTGEKPRWIDFSSNLSDKPFRVGLKWMRK